MSFISAATIVAVAIAAAATMVAFLMISTMAACILIVGTIHRRHEIHNHN